MNVVKRIKTLFSVSESDPNAIANFAKFNVASDAFNSAYGRGEAFTTRANHRYAIVIRNRSSDRVDAQELAISEFSDRADFEPYTKDELDAHTAAIESISAAFDRLTAAFAGLSRTHNLYKSSADLYKATAALYVFASEAYSRAVDCAMITALENGIHAIQLQFQITLKENRAASGFPVHDAATDEEYKARVIASAADAKRLERKASEAEARAEEICTNALAAATDAKAL